MKTRNMKSFATIAVAGGVLLSSCNTLKDLEYVVNPNPLEMHGDTIDLKINGKFAEKGLHKKVIVEVTPVLVDRKTGTERAFKTEYFKGVKAAGNGIVIPKEGKSFTYNSTVPCSCNEFEEADLKIKILAKKGDKVVKEVNVTDQESPIIADATILTPCLIEADDKLLFGTDNFVRVTSHTTESTINYLKGKSNVRSGEMKDAEMMAFQTWMNEAMANPKIVIKGANIMSYASPEGEMAKNEGLASDRAASAKTAMIGFFKKMKYEAGTAESGFYTLSPKGEDWAGLKKLIQESDHPDKNIIISVAEMNGDDAKREAEIKTLSSTYKFLEKDIFPQLRRSQVTISYDLNGLTDEELLQWAQSKPDSLKLEEVLFTANTLVDDMNEKLRLYQVAAKNFPNDWRPVNNIGYIYMMQNKPEDAATQFEKAAGMDQNAVVTNNLGVIARQKGNYSKAAELFNEALSGGKEVNYNLGIVDTKYARYGSAISNMGSYNTFNKALAQYLNGDTDGAISTLDNSEDKDSAKGQYLRAIVGARTSNKEMMLTSLKAAVAADSGLKAKAAKDREFVKYFEDADFKAAIQ